MLSHRPQWACWQRQPFLIAHIFDFAEGTHFAELSVIIQPVRIARADYSVLK